MNLPEEPIEEEEEEEEDGDEDMDADDRVVEYKDRGDRERGPRLAEGGVRSRLGGVSPASSDSDEMDYDLELKMISTPSPKKSMKMTMYADEVETNLRTLRWVIFIQFYWLILWFINHLFIIHILHHLLIFEFKQSKQFLVTVNYTGFKYDNRILIFSL